MHEVSIMAEAVRMAVETAQSSGTRRVTGLRLRVGTLSGAVPEAMRFAWDVVRHDTLAAEQALTNLKRVSHHAEVFELSAKTGDGMKVWLEFLVNQRGRVSCG